MIRRTLALWLALGLALGACGSSNTRITLTRIEPRTRVAVRSLAIAPLVDARPAVSRHDREAGMSTYWGLALVYFAFGSGRIDGISQKGDDTVDITVEGRKGSVPQQLDAFVRSVLAKASGTNPQTAPEVTLSDVRRAATALPDGITVVPILDQFDAFMLSSKDTISGSSSYQSGNYQVTRSGYSLSTASTPWFSNLRLRLVFLETRGGSVVRQATAYVATSKSGGQSLLEVLTDSVEPIAANLAAFVAQR
jgi:hypothetical protein